MNALNNIPNYNPENANAVLAQVFDTVITEFNNCEGMRRFRDGELNSRHYAALMRETYFYTRENPQLQAAATAFFRGAQRDAVKSFLRHATSEIGHDQLALNDMAAAGMDSSNIAHTRPLPSTIALTAFAYYQIYGMNPVGYLGYLYFLEFMPVRCGADYIAGLTAMGVPAEATSFLQDHSVIDVGHTQAMSDYTRQLIHSQHDLDAVVYGLRVTGELYCNFATRAFESADTGAFYGRDLAESSHNAVVIA